MFGERNVYVRLVIEFKHVIHNSSFLIGGQTKYIVLITYYKELPGCHSVMVFFILVCGSYLPFNAIHIQIEAINGRLTIDNKYISSQRYKLLDVCMYKNVVGFERKKVCQSIVITGIRVSQTNLQKTFTKIF